MRKPWFVVLFAACSPDDASICPLQACTTALDCGYGFDCVQGGCALAINCGEDPSCPQDGLPFPALDCATTGCACFARSLPQPSPPPLPCDLAHCTASPPMCDPGSVPFVYDDCYTGACIAIASCPSPPPCAEIEYPDDCTAQPGCEAVYDGSDCTGSGGGTCAQYTYVGCTDRP
jgi:hypothetical protein